MKRIPLPRLEGGVELHPARLSVTLNLRPTSRASMLLPPGESVELRQRVELFTPQGSAGWFRVTAVDEIPGEGCEVTLRHGACALSDAILPGADELSGSARTVLAALLGRQTGSERWALGDVEVPDSRALACAYNNSNLLTALTSLLDELPEYGLFFEETGAARKIHLRRLPTEDACECRLSRNLRSLTVSLDDSDLCTRVYMNDLPSPVDAASKSRWGIVARHLSANRRLTTAALTAVAKQYLALHSEPYLTVKLDAADLSRATGEAFDRFPVGRMCRVALPEERRTIRQRVVSVTYADVYGDPERAEVTLANRCLDAADYVGGLMGHVRVLRRGLADAHGTLRLEADRIELLAEEIKLKVSSDVFDELERRTTRAEISLDGLKGEIRLKADQKVTDLISERLSKAEIDIRGAQADILLKASRDEVGLLTERLGQVEIDLNAARADILLRASREETALLTQRLARAELDIDGANAAIALKASQEEVGKLTGRITDAEAALTVQAGQISTKVSAGGVASAINQTAQSVLISAAKIDLRGYVTADQLDVKIADIQDGWATSLRTGRLSCDGIAGGEADFDELTCGGLTATELKVGSHAASWLSKTVGTGLADADTRVVQRANITYLDGEGKKQSLSVVTGITNLNSQQKLNTSTVRYLGY